MASISITTTQNVTIDHTLAEFKQRLLAYIIDALIILAWFIVHLFIGLIFFIDETKRALYMHIIVIPFVCLFTLFMEYFMDGQTPGKRSMNLRVVKLNGKEPEFIDYFLRWSLRGIEIYLSSGVLASIMINTTDRKQRLADLIAGTVLVKVQNRYLVTAEDLLKISSQSNYIPMYPEVLMFTESDMLAIKKLIDRYYVIGNAAYRQLTYEAASRIALKMGVTMKENKPELFLKTIVKDFVVLTR